jgi:hypothetical protein
MQDMDVRRKMLNFLLYKRHDTLTEYVILYKFLFVYVLIFYVSIMHVRNLHLGALSHPLTGFIRGILRGVRYAKSLRVLFLHRRSPSWTTLVLYSRAVIIFNEPTIYPSAAALWSVNCMYCTAQYKVSGCTNST